MPRKKTDKNRRRHKLLKNIGKNMECTGLSVLYNTVQYNNKLIGIIQKVKRIKMDISE